MSISWYFSGYLVTSGYLLFAPFQVGAQGFGPLFGQRLLFLSEQLLGSGRRLSDVLVHSSIFALKYGNLGGENTQNERAAL